MLDTVKTVRAGGRGSFWAAPTAPTVARTRLARLRAGCDNIDMWRVTRRALKLFGESGLWKLIGTVHIALYRLTGGRFVHQMAGLASMLLTTTGRRSGEARTVALTYVPDGRDYVVVASNGGSDRHPAWWLNLQRTPQATVRVGTTTVPVVAYAADTTERARLWPKLTAANPFYARYEQITSRTIPVVVLRPTNTYEA